MSKRVLIILIIFFEFAFFTFSGLAEHENRGDSEDKLRLTETQETYLPIYRHPAMYRNPSLSTLGPKYDPEKLVDKETAQKWYRKILSMLGKSTSVKLSRRKDAITQFQEDGWYAELEDGYKIFITGYGYVKVYFPENKMYKFPEDEGYNIIGKGILSAIDQIKADYPAFFNNNFESYEDRFFSNAEILHESVFYTIYDHTFTGLSYPMKEWLTQDFVGYTKLINPEDVLNKSIKPHHPELSEENLLYYEIKYVCDDYLTPQYVFYFKENDPEKIRIYRTSAIDNPRNPDTSDTSPWTWAALGVASATVGIAALALKKKKT
ncbi:MAG: hypothetical protein ACI4N6_03095 [Eubacteriales bacterium]